MIELMMGGGSAPLPRFMVSLEDGAITDLSDWSVTMLPDFNETVGTNFRPREGVISPCGNFVLVAYSYSSLSSIQCYMRMWNVEDIKNPVLLVGRGFSFGGNQPNGDLGISFGGEYFVVGSVESATTNRLELFTTMDASSYIIRRNYGSSVFRPKSCFVASNEDLIFAYTSGTLLYFYDVKNEAQSTVSGVPRDGICVSHPESNIVLIAASGRDVSIVNPVTLESRSLIMSDIINDRVQTAKVVRVNGEDYVFIFSTVPNTQNPTGTILKWDGDYMTDPVEVDYAGILRASDNCPFDITDNGSLAKITYGTSANRPAQLIMQGENFYPTIPSMLEGNPNYIHSTTLLAPTPETWSRP